MKAEHQYIPPAGAARGVSSMKDDIRKEELRLDRKLKIERKPKLTYYERQLEKFGFKS